MLKICKIRFETWFSLSKVIVITAMRWLDIELKINPLGIPELLSANFSDKNASVEEARLLQVKNDKIETSLLIEANNLDV